MTDRAARFVLLCCNAIFFLVAVGCIFACFLAPLGARGRVTALDRAGALDAAKVATVAPAGCVMPASRTTVIVNRTALGDWIAEQDQFVAGISTKLFALMAFANLLICIFLFREPTSVGPPAITNDAYVPP